MAEEIPKLTRYLEYGLDSNISVPYALKTLVD